jgi:redox-sensing transcriptional repressor
MNGKYKMDKKLVPDIVVARLPLYLQTLNRLQQEGEYNTSSKDLGKRIDISAAQIRKDLSHFGEFGKQGTGYSISFLIEKLEDILHVNKVWGMALIGVGFLGHAIANFNGFQNHGFQIKCIFDNDLEKIGTNIGEYVIYDSRNLAEVIQKENIKIAMITVDAEHAQNVANQVVKAGVKAILNYAPVKLIVPKSVQVQNIDPIIEIQHMTYYLD